ncbi:MAG: Phenylalanine-tRNA ligase beta subunit [Parcubacteria group bacterium GW2011_GWA1_47_8]|nr:MAG: Phenylalanine-tRNA ligase beta subunit [Parcubacteria group bacterium GW2011_GWA1_47_8]KKW07126.1 MAG: Phenylalanine-tRNA ligase beta subunit [Parcubacteria group bacterium GW2011_GWA2_49_16]
MNIPISYQWLKSHFEKDLPAPGTGARQANIPSPEEVSALFMQHLCEVEGVEQRGGDTIFDLKIMPDRGHDLLAHRGIAREISVLSGMPMKSAEAKKKSAPRDITTLRVSVADMKLCPRYMGRVVENVKVGESPAWLRERLESVGGRSINNIVDITNYVMLELGQPMHVFDRGKLVREKDGAVEIVVRNAKQNETITTLDGKEIVLSPETLVIADSARPLAIAGIKGGKDVGVDETTTAIVLEAANFSAVNTRKTSARVGIRTDSSRRFEHDLSPMLAEEAMTLATELLLEMCPDAQMGKVVDVYPLPKERKEIIITTADINGILGSKLSDDEVEGVLKRLSFEYHKDGEMFVVTPPAIRLDLVIVEDMVEEIGRVYGYDKIIDAPLPALAFNARPLKAYYSANMIRDVLVAQGFSEVYTYSFQNTGEFAVVNPVAEDKGFLRKDLGTGIGQALVLNMRNAPLLGLDEIKIFEIGKVFPGVMEEKLSCAIGVEFIKATKKKDALVRTALEEAQKVLSETLGVPVAGVFTGNIFEFDLGALLEKLPEINVREEFHAVTARYQKPSAYPFVLRDIALWVPDGVTSDEVLAVISADAGNLLRTKRLFDVFTKEFPEGKKTSYAFSLVFQSNDKTLSDDEVNGIMERITTALHAHTEWQVR